MKALTQSSIKVSEMNKKILFYSLLLGSILSCNAEKVNLSPMHDLDSSGKYRNTSFTDRADQINYSSEITNLISSFPKFRNESINLEVQRLKQSLNDYIGSLEVFKYKEIEKSLTSYQKSYKKLQKMKVYLNPDEAAVLNRYMVRIKTNMNVLEDQQRKGTITIND